MDRLKAEALIRNVADFNGIDPELACAIAEAESGFDELACRFEPNWKHAFKIAEFGKQAKISEDTERILQMCSFGMMQVMGTVARELGLKGSILELSKPEIGVKFGCLKIKDLVMKYNGLEDQIAAYNAGAPRKVDGHYTNASYVNKVKEIYARRKSRLLKS